MVSDKSKRPLRLANSKNTAEIEDIILDMCKSEMGFTAYSQFLLTKSKRNGINLFGIGH